MNDAANASSFDVNVWQSFTAGVTGVLTRVEYGGFRQTTDFNATCRIYSGEGTSGTLLATVPFVVAGGGGPWTFLPVDINPLLHRVNITAGQVYTFQITSGTRFLLLWGTAGGDIPVIYSGGTGQLGTGGSNLDLRFKTFVTQNYTPPQTSIAAAVSMTGPFTATGPITATSLSGDGSGLTNVVAVSAATATNAVNATNATNATNSTQLNGQPGSFYTNASNLSTGTLSNARTTATEANTANTIVARDPAGNFSAGTITATLAGNASSATTATNATNAANAANADMVDSGGFATGALIGPGTVLGANQHDVLNRGVKSRVGYATHPTGFIEFAGMQAVVVPTTNGVGNSADVTFHTWEANTAISREVMRINGRGRVGILTASPQSPFHVTAANIAAANDWMIRITNTAGGTGGIRISNDGFLDITNVVQGGTAARLNSTGVWGTFSDRRLKKDIEPALGNLEAAMRLRPVTYAMTHDDPGTPRHLGFIAQEVREVIPEYVMGDESKGNLAVAYGQMSVIAIGAIQELKAENEALQAENTAIKQRLASLESLAARGGLSVYQTAGLGAIVGLPLLGFAAFRRRKVAPAVS